LVIRKTLLLVAVLSLSLASCAPAAAAASEPQATQAAPPTATASPTPAATPTATAPPVAFEKAWENFPPDFDPLTGLQVADPAILERRPVSVKISNYPRSNRPQWGLSLADIVYEYYHNNDLTRFHAVFYGKDAPQAGPIRSGRLFDSYLMDIYESNMVFASADSRVLDRFYREQLPWQLVASLEGVCPANPVCRIDPDQENFLVTDTSTIADYALAHDGENSRPALHGMSFAQQAPASATSVDKIYLYYSYSAYSYWDFDPDSGRYLRFQDAQEDLAGRGQAYEPLVDRLNGSQVAADNVVVLLVPHFHEFYRPATDTTPATEIVDMEFTGEGTAYAFRDGQAYVLEWHVNPGELLYLTDENGERWPFKPGATWFQVMTDRSRLDQQEAGWFFEFVFRRP
jgi:hypothetical protein